MTVEPEQDEPDDQDDTGPPAGSEALEPAESGTTARLRQAVRELNRRSRQGVW